MIKTLHFKPDYAESFNPALAHCNGLKLLVMSLCSCLCALALVFVFGKLRGWRAYWFGEMNGFHPLNSPGMFSMMQTAKCKSARNDDSQTKTVPSFSFSFFPPRKLTSGFKTICSLLRAYSSFSIILCNHQCSYFAIIWSDVSKLSLWRQHRALHTMLPLARDRF